MIVLVAAFAGIWTRCSNEDVHPCGPSPSSGQGESLGLGRNVRSGSLNSLLSLSLGMEGLTERHPSSCKAFASKLIGGYQDAGLQCFDAHQMSTILFSLASLQIFPSKLITFVSCSGVAVHYRSAQRCHSVAETGDGRWHHRFAQLGSQSVLIDNRHCMMSNVEVCIVPLNISRCKIVRGTTYSIFNVCKGISSSGALPLRVEPVERGDMGTEGTG